MYVEVSPPTLQWAIDRSRKKHDDLEKNFSNLSAWLQGTAQPTFKQLEKFARATYTPIGVFFAPGVPEEKLPIADFRSFGNRQYPFSQPSANLLDSIYLCQQRQAWYHGYCMQERLPPAALLEDKKSISIGNSPKKLAQQIRHACGFEGAEYTGFHDAFSKRCAALEERGILTMYSGIVGSNTGRPLSEEEFLGFALYDAHAPLIFVNGKGSDASKSFTLMHELAHLCLRQSGVSDSRLDAVAKQERWCNAVAAEILVPLEHLRAYAKHSQIKESAHIASLARRYKASELVILLRLKDLGFFNDENLFWERFKKERKRLQKAAAAARKTQSGGNFYNSKFAAVGARFARALAISAMEGRTLYRDAMQLLGVAKFSTFDEFSRLARSRSN